MSKLSIDIGFSATKVVGENINFFKFPTAVGFYRESSSNITTSKDKIYEWNNRKYLVGEAALTEDTQIYNRNIEYILKYAPLFITHAIDLSNIIPTNLVLGLPVDQYKKYKDDYAKISSDYVMNGITYKFQEVKVFPQSIGILKDYIDTTKPNINENGYILDIGFNTVIVLRYNKLSAQAEGTRQFNQMGISKALDELGNHITNNYQITLNHQELNNAFITKNITYYGKKIDLTEIINKIIEGYIEFLMSMLHNEFERFLVKSDRIVLAGGGAVYMTLPENYKDFSYIMPNPEFSNARGFYTL